MLGKVTVANCMAGSGILCQVVSAGRWFIMGVVFLLLAACSETQPRYGQQFVQADLSRLTDEELEERQDFYFQYLCRQAGVDSAQGNGRLYNCADFDFDPEVWTLIVHQGWNDIDRRCDSFLEWIYEKRHSRSPTLGIVDGVRTTANAILGFTNPGSKAIEIVGSAFGLLHKGVEYYYERSLQGIELSTINTLVLNGRHKFRKENSEDVYNTKPAAEYAIRSYLQICLPFAVSSDFNNFSVLASSGVTDFSDKSVNKSPSDVDMLGINKPIVASLKPEDDFGDAGDRPERRGPVTPENFADIFTNPLGRERRDLEALQRAFCLQDFGLGVVGQRTKASIEIFEETVFEAVLPNFKATQNNKIDDTEYDIIIGQKDCANGEFKNFFERVNYQFNSTSDNTDNINDLIDFLNAHLKLEGENKLKYGLKMSDETLRKRIAEARSKLKAREFPKGFAADHVTEELLQKLQKNPDNG